MFCLAVIPFIVCLCIVSIICEAAAYSRVKNTYRYEPETVAEEKKDPDELHVAVMYFTNEEAEERITRLQNEKEIRTKARTSYAKKAKTNSSGEQVYYLACIIAQETAGVNEGIMLRVGNVVLNRVADPRFPNSVYDVITAPGQYGHGNGEPIVFYSYISQDGIQRSYDVARRLLNGERVLPENVVWQAGFPQGNGLYEYFEAEPHDFYFCY